MGQDKDALSQAALRGSEDRIWHLEQKVSTAQSDLVRSLRMSHAYKKTAEELRERTSAMEALLSDRDCTIQALQAELSAAKAESIASWQKPQMDGCDLFLRRNLQCGQVGPGNFSVPSAPPGALWTGCLVSLGCFLGQFVYGFHYNSLH
jgi:hypothetical protein